MISLKKISLIITFIIINAVAFSQCAMCKAVVETDLQNGGTAGKGINEGIIYLMIVPYILIATVGYFVYKHYKKNKQTEQV